MPAVMAYLAGRVPAGRRAEAMGRLSAFRGVISFPSPFIGSLLFERGGIRLPTLVTLVGIVFVTLGILLLVQEPRTESLSEN
jgi:MFS family permease